MLIVPLLAGVVLRTRVAPFALWWVPLAAAVFTGYSWYNALTLWFRAPKGRREQYLQPINVYGAVTAVLVAVALAGGGWSILAWLPAALPLVVLAVWLARRGDERSLASGFATIALAVGIALVIRFPFPRDVLDGWPDSAPHLAVIAAIFGYFEGTVLHVKAMIRERGQRDARRRSLTWHSSWTLLVTVATLSGWLGAGWIVFFAFLTMRAGLLPAMAATRPLRPLHIGLVEIAASLLVVVLVFWSV